MKNLRKLGIYGILVIDNKVLAVKKNTGIYANLFDAPGEGPEIGETFESAAIRIFQDQTGIEISGINQIAALDHLIIDTFILGADCSSYHHMAVFYQVFTEQKDIVLKNPEFEWVDISDLTPENTSPMFYKIMTEYYSEDFNPERIKIREFNNTIEDAEIILEIDRETFNECKYSAEEIINIVNLPENKIFLAFYNEIPLGFISLMKVQTLHYKGMWVDLLAVRPDFRNLGIAKLLISKAIETASEANVELMSSLVAIENIPSNKAFINNNFEPLNKPYNLLFYKGEL